LSIYDLKIVAAVSKSFHSLSKNITHPIQMGIFPISIWVNQILPKLDFKRLKKMQRVRRASNRILICKEFAGVLFRADTNPQTLKGLPQGYTLQLHPFFDSMS